MALTNTLEITVLGSRKGHQAFAAARLGSQVGFASMPEPSQLRELFEMRDRIHNCIFGRDKLTDPELDSFGSALGRIIIRDGIEEFYSAARPTGVRLALIINDCDLQQLPWEYMHGPKELPGPEPNRSVVRIVSSGQGAHFAPRKRPENLNVLLLVSADPADKVVPAADLAKTMANTFKTRMNYIKASLTVRSVPTISAFNAAIQEGEQDWDVIHFLGHGEVRTIAKREVAGLILSDGGNSSFYNCGQLASVLLGRPPRLLVLSACSTASPEFSFDFSNAASVLARKNIPAILANQMVITPDCIAEFCAGLYRALMKNGDIDEAVAVGRVASHGTLIRDEVDSARVEWGIPVLYRHFDAQKLFD